MGKRIAFDLSAVELAKGTIANTAIANDLAALQLEITKLGELLVLRRSAGCRKEQQQRNAKEDELIEHKR